MQLLCRPLSFVLTQRQLDWLDERRLEGALSRSAALRVALDQFIQQQSDNAPASTPRA